VRELSQGQPEDVQRFLRGVLADLDYTDRWCDWWASEQVQEA
jgi:hypothetical protein